MENNLLMLVLAAGAFVVTHFAISSTPLRGWLIKTVGEGPYLGLFSVIATGALVWMVLAFGDAPRQILWAPVEVLGWLPMVVMPFALILVVGGLAGPNPTSVKQEKALRGADPARGILRITRHPVQWGIILWALAHILARGELAALMFFGGFFVTSALGTVLIDRKRRISAGADWESYLAVTSNLPFAAILAGRNRFSPGEFGWLRLATALGLYVVLMGLHPVLFGLPPF